jgi:hypothetical protein
MPAQPFKVHVDPDALVRQDLAAAASLPPAAGKEAGKPAGKDTGQPAGKDAKQPAGKDAKQPAKQPAGKDARQPAGLGGVAEQHGARDGRLAARQQSERARAGRASGVGGGRSYAFRRS